MKLVPGYMFKVIKNRLEFKIGETYRIYHISPIKEGIEYIFQSNCGNIKHEFESTDQAESIINKISGK